MQKKPIRHIINVARVVSAPGEQKSSKTILSVAGAVTGSREKNDARLRGRQIWFYKGAESHPPWTLPARQFTAKIYLSSSY
jgi:hypothetical protein